MEYVAGVLIGAAVAALGAVVGLDRERSFYPTVLMVIAAYYVLFAAMSGSAVALAVETLIAGGFFLAAIVGFRRSLWLVAAGLVAHGAFDQFHGWLVVNPAVPGWWPGFCLAVDVALGLWLAVLLARGGGPRAAATAG